MIRKLLLTLAGSVALATGAQAQLLTEIFNYPDASALVGQGGWSQIGTVATNPITVNGGAISLATSGQDVGNGFTSVNSGSLYAGFTLTLSAAGTAGDYFFAFNTAATATNYASRFFAKSSGTGFVLGLQEGVTGATPSYMTTPLVFGTSYRVVVRYDQVTGAANNTGIFYVNPTDTQTEANNTPAVTLVPYAGTSAEDAAEAAVSLRQGTAASAPAISSFDNLTVSTSFGDVAAAPVPEPSTYAMMAGGLFLLVAIRRLGRRAI